MQSSNHIAHTAHMDNTPSPSTLTSIGGWITALLIGVSSLYKAFKDSHKDQRLILVSESDSIFKQAEEMIRILREDNTSLRAEIKELKERVTELERERRTPNR